MSRALEYDVIVVGGGASGMMAALRAAERGKRVLILEKNRRLGNKLSITGGGRCNITNAETNSRELLKAYGAAEPFLHSLFSRFGVKDTFSFFESRGLPLVVEARKRAFPKSEKAADVVKLFEAELKKAGVTIMLGSPVSGVECASGEITGMRSGKEIYRASSYIFSTGGLSHPETGSTGDGFRWLSEAGHTVIKPTPSIVPLRTEEAWSKKLAGKTLPDAKIVFSSEGTKAFALRGSILFTHFGLSGPLILNSAGKVADLLHAGKVTAAIDMFPDLDLGALEKKLLAVFDANKNKALKNVIKEALPPGMASGVLTHLGSAPDIETKTHSITREERKALVRMLKALPLTISGLMGFDRAVVADGGVPLEEIDMKTMRSKKVRNLFVTGDLLHITRPSGGFSLQLCWSTGFAAGDSA